MLLDNWEYIKIPRKTGDIKKDVENLLCENGKETTFIHVKNVAETNLAIAEKYSLDKHICETGGYLHDISAVIDPADMLAYAKNNNFYIDEAESKYPFLLHQRISKIIAEEHFNISNKDILSSIECHTTLKKDCTNYDMALFIADKLSWDKETTPPFFDEVNAALTDSLESASLAYMNYVAANNLILHPHSWFTEAWTRLRGIYGS